ncbi:MAG TPA: chromate efflux transporter [Candidatus Polarisedimenticolia bacterium]|nr:chromate efflux transporter [Candidatus Polarisedimenticolia bacterium]
MSDAPVKTPVSLSELAFVFLKLGTIAFGGPAVHIAMMEDEFVRKRRWITEEDFLDRVAAASLIPGPSSTEVGIFIGRSLRGWTGLIVAGSCFIIPAAFLVSLIAAAYVRFGSLPPAEGILRAIKAVVIAIIVHALWSLGKTAAKTRLLALIGVASAVLSFVGVSPLLVLMFAGASCGIGQWLQERKSNPVTLCAIRLSKVFSPTGLTGLAVAFAMPISLGRLFLSFLKIGSLVFGSGYVLLAFLRSEFVDHLHWLTEKQLIDSVAVGQFTPGPVFATATFIGYLLGGVPGAVVSTLGIFLPGFVFVAISGPLIPKLRRSPAAGAVLDGVVVGSVALIAVVAWQLGKASITDRLTVSILVVSVIATFGFKVNSVWLILGAAIIGWITRG